MALILTYLLDTALVGLYCLACTGLALGARLLLRPVLQATVAEKSAPLAVLPRPVALATLFLGGMALINAGLTVLGLTGGIKPLPLALLLATGIPGLWLSRAQAAMLVRRTGSALNSWRREPRWMAILVALLVLLMLGFGLAALARGPEGDAEAFYLVYPKIIAATGWLAPLPGPFHDFSAIGLPAELHFAALMALADAHAAKLLVWPVATAALALLIGIVAACGGGRLAQVLTAAILLSSTTFNHYIFDGKVDLFAAAFGLAALYWLLAADGKTAPRESFLAGVFAGLATTAKFSYLPALGVAMLVLMLALAQRPRARSFLIQGAWIASGAVLGWLPQLLKNGVLFGAPLAPFVGLPMEEGQNWLRQVWFSPETTRHIVLTYPLALVLGRYPMQGGGLSLLLLAFAPLALLRPRRAWWSNRLSAVTLAAVAATAVWVILRPSVIAPRYILAPLLLIVPVVALAAESAWTRPGSRLLGAGMLATVLAALTASAWHLLPVPGGVATQVRQGQSACTLASESCPALLELAQSAPLGQRVFLASYYVYWLRPDQLQCRDSYAEQRRIVLAEDPVSLLRQRGFSLVVVDHASFSRLGELLDRAVQDNQGIRLRHGAGKIKVYDIAAGGSPVAVCSNAGTRGWQVREQAQ